MRPTRAELRFARVLFPRRNFRIWTMRSAKTRNVIGINSPLERTLLRFAARESQISKILPNNSADDSATTVSPRHGRENRENGGCEGESFLLFLFGEPRVVFLGTLSKWKGPFRPRRKSKTISSRHPGVSSERFINRSPLAVCFVIKIGIKPLRRRAAVCGSLKRPEIENPQNAQMRRFRS